MCIHLRQLQLFAVLGGTLEHDLSQLVVPRLRAGIVHAAKEVLHGFRGPGSPHVEGRYGYQGRHRRRLARGGKRKKPFHGGSANFGDEANLYQGASAA